jgi:DNA-binding winged helix-turn-helix (wHTH) protein/TolB-like protein/Flp pilus assembly protein TadD
MRLKTGILFEYGPFRLDSAEHRLTRDGTVVPLAPRAFELLLFLVQNPGRLLTKDEIMRAVWADSFVEEANLTVAISILRKALGEKEGNFRYIETVPKRGYRFLAPVRQLKSPEPVPDEESSEPDSIASSRSALAGSAIPPALPSGHISEENRTRDGPALISSTAAYSRTSSRPRIVMIIVAVLALALTLASYLTHLRHRLLIRAAPVQHSLAILPLRNLRQTPTDDFLSFALADAVITRLGAVSAVTVRPSSEVEKYKGQTIDARKVAADLNVDTVLTGTFIHEGDDLRITYQLVDARTEKILGRDMIDVKYDNLLAVQDAVTQQIIQGLALNLSQSESKRLKPNAPVSPLAYEYYLRGVDLVGSHDFPMAIQMLEKSAEIDPNYALTWAWLGQSYNSTASFQFGGREQYKKAKSAFEHALALEPSQMEARIFLANLLIDTGEVENAVPLLRAAQKDNPNHAAVHWELGYAYRFAGMLNESVAECERARQIDPSVRANGAVKTNGAVLNSYLYLGEYHKFLASLPDVDDSSFLLFYRGFGEYHQGSWNQAVTDFDRAWKLDHTLYTQIGRAFRDSITHNTGEGRELLRDLENKIQQRGVGDPEGTYKIAQAYAVLGDKESALRMLRYSIEHGFFAWPYFNTDPLLSSIRQESQFPELMSIAHGRYTMFRTRYF